VATEAKFIFSNILDDITSFTVSDEHDLYPGDNLRDRDHTTLWKGTDAVDKTFEAYVGTTAAEADCLVMPNENAYAAGAKIKLQAANDSGYTVDNRWVIGGASTWHDVTEDDTPLWYEDFTGPGTTSRKYWKLHVGGLADAGLLLGDIFYGLVVATDRHPGGVWGYGKKDQAKRSSGRGFSTSVSWGAPLKILTVECRAIPKALLDEIVAGYDLVKGADGWPFFYRDEFGDLHHVMFHSPIRYKHHRGLLWDATAVLIEVPD
jgi:hypothetical protein